MKIAIFQMHVQYGKPAENLAKVERFLREAASRTADLAVLPELWPTGFDLPNVEGHIANPAHAAITERLRAMAKELGVDIMAGSMMCRSDKPGKVCNTAHYISNEGDVLATYSKMHLYPPMDEDKYLAPGSTHDVFSTRFRPAAMAVCYDLRFPELFRQYALDGAQIVLVSSAWPADHVGLLRDLARIRALENQYFLIVVNCSGSTGGQIFGGMSAIYDPVGRPILECGPDEQAAFADIDFAILDKARAALPALDGYRSDIDWLRPPRSGADKMPNAGKE